MGEGSSNQGDVHEGLNFAAIHKLPFVFVVENNGYAISVPLARQVAGSSVADRAAGYGIPGVTVDGADVLACYAAARDAVARARAGDGPTLDRGQGDAADRALVRRPADQVPLRGGAGRREGARPAAAVPRPAARCRRPDRRVEGRISAEITAAVDEATEYAEAQPDPDPSTALRYVYAEEVEGRD